MGRGSTGSPVFSILYTVAEALQATFARRMLYRLPPPVETVHTCKGYGKRTRMNVLAHAVEKARFATSSIPTTVLYTLL